MHPTTILLAFFVCTNITALFIMYRDKQRSQQGSAEDRTPEGLLFFLAAALGSIGVYAGMYLFRHKTRKWYFQIGIPLLIIENVATMYVISLLWR